MQLKIIEVVAAKGHSDTLRALAEDSGAVDWHVSGPGEDDRQVVRILTAQSNRQALVDQIETQLADSKDWRLSFLPVEGTLPAIEEDEEEAAKAKARALTATREELYNSVAGGAQVDTNLLILVALSTLVAGIGLITNNVAVIIGAMVIAPLLGPNLAFALATALGDHRLMGRAIIANGVGVGLAIALAAAVAAVIPLPLNSAELISRTDVSADVVVLALASGAAAALSLTTGVSTTLVGVMVAVALLPPATTAGLMAGSGQWQQAIGAGLLLAVNVICVNLAAQVVFVSKGIKPHRWLVKEASRQSTAISLCMWIALLLVAIGVIYLRRS